MTMKKLLALAFALVLGTACGGGGGNDKAATATGNTDKTRTACEALAQEPPNLYDLAVKEWNGHADASDATYREYTNDGGFDAWATANGKPTEPDPNVGATDDAADQAAVEAAGGPLADKLQAVQEAAAEGDLGAAMTASTEMQLICSTVGVTLSS